MCARIKVQTLQSTSRPEQERTLDFFVVYFARCVPTVHHMHTTTYYRICKIQNPQQQQQCALAYILIN